MKDLLERNYVEACKLFQRCLVVGFIAAIAFLAISLSAENPEAGASNAIPFVGIDFGNPAVAALITVGVYFSAGIVACLASRSINNIRVEIDNDNWAILKTYPSVASAPTWLSAIALIPLAGFFFVAFQITGIQMGWFNAAGSAILVSIPFIVSVTWRLWVHNNALQATQQSCAPER